MTYIVKGALVTVCKSLPITTPPPKQKLPQTRTPESANMTSASFRTLFQSSHCEVVRGEEESQLFPGGNQAMRKFDEVLQGGYLTSAPGQMAQVAGASQQDHETRGLCIRSTF
eukprot:1712697-Amphidinium_carterae.1